MLDSMASNSRREYLRAWRKKNPEKVKEYNISYWKRRAERERAERSNKEVEHAEATREKR